MERELEDAAWASIREIHRLGLAVYLWTPFTLRLLHRGLRPQQARDYDCCCLLSNAAGRWLFDRLWIRMSKKEASTGNTKVWN